MRRRFAVQGLAKLVISGLTRPEGENAEKNSGNRTESWRKGLINALNSIEMRHEAREIESCGAIRMGGCASCGEDLHPVPIRCGLRVCPDCGLIAANDLFDRVYPTIERAWTAGKGGRYRLRFITLTTPKPSGVTRAYIESTYTHLLGDGSTEGLVKNVWRAKLKKPGAGIIAGCETGHGGMVHVHILYWGPWVDLDELRSYWERRTGAFVVHCKLITIERDKTLQRAIREVVKYPIKMHGKKKRKDGSRQLIAPQLAAWTLSALRGKRRVRCYGIFYRLDDLEPRDTKLCCPLCGDQLRIQPGSAMTYSDTLAWFRSDKNRYLAQLCGMTDFSKYTD